MKLIIISSILLTFFAFQSCNFNKSFKKDLISGAVYKADGLSTDNVEMEVNRTRTSNTIFTFGDRVEFFFNNVNGLTKRKGKTYPGMSMFIIRNGTDTVMNKNDLLSDLEDGTDLQPLVLKAYFNVPNPTNENDKYKVILKIRDEKGSGKILYEMPFRVKKSSTLSIQSNKIEYSNIYLWNETQKKVVNGKKINQADKYILFIEGLDGFDLIENNAFPATELEIKDKNGNYVLYEKNVFESASELGVDHIALKDNQATVEISFSKGIISNPCHFKATITDLKNSKKNVQINADMVIE